MKTVCVKAARIFSVLLIFVLSECVRRPQQVLSTSNRNYTLDLLFEHEGCKMYRFKDGDRYVYWTDCRGKVETAYRETNKYGSSEFNVQNETITAGSNGGRKK